MVRSGRELGAAPSLFEARDVQRLADDARVEPARHRTALVPHARREAAVLEVRRRAVAEGVADAAGEGGGLGGEARVHGKQREQQLGVRGEEFVQLGARRTRQRTRGERGRLFKQLQQRDRHVQRRALP